MPYLSRWGSNWEPRQHWLVGLIALFPAWLIAFLGLLPSSGGPEYDPLPRSALLSSVVALIGFGLDSYIEVASGLVLIWRLRKHGFSNDEEEEAAEKKAIFFVGATFFLLALYVTYESGKKLLFQEHPDESLIGIILAIVSLIVMPVLAFYKKRIAAEINSRALRADALETLACSYLSLTLVVGLGANALFGL